MQSDPRAARLYRWLGPALVLVLAAALRLWNLGNAHDLMNQFDETYYVKDAWTLSRLGYEGGVARRTPNERFLSGDVGLVLDRSGVRRPSPARQVDHLARDDGDHAHERMGLAHHDRDPRHRGRARPDADREADDALDDVRRDRGSAHGDRRARDLDEPGRAARHPAHVLRAARVLVRPARPRTHDDAHRRDGRGALQGEQPPLWGPILWNRPWIIAAGAALGAACAVKWSGVWVLAGLGVYLVVTDALARRRAGVLFWPTDARPAGRGDVRAPRARRLRRLPRIVDGMARHRRRLRPALRRREPGDGPVLMGAAVAAEPVERPRHDVQRRVADHGRSHLREPRVAVAAAHAPDRDVLPPRRVRRGRMRSGERLLAGDRQHPEPAHLVRRRRGGALSRVPLHRRARLAPRARAHRRRGHLRAVAVLPRADGLPVLHGARSCRS